MAVCADCRFFDAGMGLGEGECHRRPPTPFSSYDFRGMWPGVDAAGWCGEFEERLCGVEGCVLADGHADRWHRLSDGKLMQVVALEETDG